MRKGEIYLANFEFPHIGEIKTRPVIILQSNEDNENSYYPFIIVAPITTKKIDRIYQQDVFLPAVRTDIRRDSKVLLGALTTTLKTSLVEFIGGVDEEIMDEIDLKILRLS